MIDREHAQEFSEALDMVGAGWYRQAVVAGQMGVHESLGLTWTSWCDQYLPRLKMVAKARQNVVAELDAGGLSNVQIAAILGVDEGTVRNDKKKASENSEAGQEPEHVTASATVDSSEISEGDADVAPPHVTQNSGEVEWYTPAAVVDAARHVLGDIDLDPASSAIANETVRADRYYTVDDDGLTQPWAGRVFMNPPYRTGLVDRFVTRIVTEYTSGAVAAAVVLTNNATDTRWWQQLAHAAAAMCFPAGRIRFLAPEGERNTPLQGQTVAYLGPDADKFVFRFAKFGEVR